MKYRILCFGDSNTWGYNAVNEERYNEEIRWTRRLGRMLGEDFEIIEEGLSGRNAVCDDPLKEGLNGLSYFYPCLMTHKPIDLVIIMLGTNDAKERFSLTSYNIAMGITRLAEKARHSESGRGGSDPEILVVTPAPIGQGYAKCPAFLSMGRESDVKTEELHEHLSGMISQCGFHYLNAGEHLEMGTTDHMHLDEEGHKKMAELLQKKIREIMTAVQGQVMN